MPSVRSKLVPHFSIHNYQKQRERERKDTALSHLRLGFNRDYHYQK